MITFGLTGGIASGKSTVTKTFLKHNIPMVDADIVARKIVEPESFGWHLIKSVFGSDYFLQDGTLDRKKLGKLIFSNPEEKAALDVLMLPLIDAESSKQIEEAHKNSPIVGYDGALIIEAGNADKYLPLIVVACPPNIQLERLIKRNNYSQEEAMSRIESQMPLAKKIEVANYVIDTSGSIEHSIEQTEKIIDELIIRNTKQNYSRMDRLP
jgi:dephospho-CoA kinase